MHRLSPLFCLFEGSEHSIDNCTVEHTTSQRGNASEWKERSAYRSTWRWQLSCYLHVFGTLWSPADYLSISNLIQNSKWLAKCVIVQWFYWQLTKSYNQFKKRMILTLLVTSWLYFISYQYIPNLIQNFKWLAKH